MPKLSELHKAAKVTMPKPKKSGHPHTNLGKYLHSSKKKGC